MVRRAVLAVASDLGCAANNMLLVRCACPEDNVHMFRSTDFLSFAGPCGYSLGGLGGLPSAGLRGLTAAARLVGNVLDDNGRLILEYGPVVGMNEFGELGSILRVDKRGSLFQRMTCPTPMPDAYAKLLRQNDDEAEELTSVSEARGRVQQEGSTLLSELESSGSFVDKDWYPHAGDLVRALLENRAKCALDIWTRKSKLESLCLSTYNVIHSRIQKLICEFHKTGKNDGNPVNKWDEQAHSHYR